eukprot:6189837-Pleurochrysis_carterae.AAC.2
MAGVTSRGDEAHGPMRGCAATHTPPHEGRAQHVRVPRCSECTCTHLSISGPRVATGELALRMWAFAVKVRLRTCARLCMGLELRCTLVLDLGAYEHVCERAHANACPGACMCARACA